MATLNFDFSAASDPALALRIANLITQDIEKLERQVFNTSTNWQRMDKPFKAHYAMALVNRMDGVTHAAALDALPSYEKNAANYKRDSKRRGRPLTEYAHKVGTAMPVQVNQTKPIESPATPVTAQESESQLDDEIMELLSAPPPDKTPVERMQDSRAQSRPQAQPNADDTREGEPESEVDAAMKALADALKNQKPSALDENRVREIAREEDAPVKEVVKALATRLATLTGPTIVTVERKEQDTTTTVELGLQHVQFPTLLKLCNIRNHDGYQFPVWLPGPAGSGKTTAARNVAKALGVPFQFTGAVDNPYQLLGFRDAGGTYHRTSFREAFECGGVFLWDEVDASNPNALTVFNAALENGVCAFPDGVVTRHADCIIIAAANTYGHGATHEYVGRNKLDAATVDRFIMLDWQYDEKLETALAGDNAWTKYVQRARKACIAAGIKHVISPRASIRGRLLIDSGIAEDQVINMVLRKGLPDDSWKTITSRM